MFSDETNVLMVGAWRNGLGEATATYVQEVEKRRAQGHRQLPYESTVAELVDLLDSYDQFAVIADESDYPADLGPAVGKQAK